MQETLDSEVQIRQDRSVKNLVLFGFMGSGKTTVGRLAASELNFRFMDMDRRIEQTTGMSISEIIRQQGEETFRDLESKEVAELADQMDLVIATGGGVVLRRANVEILERHGILIYLHVDADTVWNRTHHRTHRPLLRGEDPAGRIRTLLEQRHPLYDAIPNQINTIGRSCHDVCMDVVRIYRSKQHA
jgi:shikimate kinase